MGDIVNAVADVFGFGPASKQAEATTEAAGISAQASREALDLQRRMYEEGVARQQPWYEAGKTALNKLIPEATSYTPFGMAQFQADPGYAFRLSEGQKALERSAAARGGLLSGATGKALTRYGQEAGSQEYMNAFNRYQAERAARLNPLQSLAGVGQTTAQQMGAAGQGYAGAANQLAMTNAANMGNLALMGGNIRASQYGTAGRALEQALNTDWNRLGSRAQAAFSQTGPGQAGFGTGTAYGNEDYGQYF